MQYLDVGPGWVALMCALYYVNPLGCFWPFCAAVLCHELGHAVALFCCGVPIRQLRLNLGGAVLETGTMDYRCELICALAGPAANLLMLSVSSRFPMFSILCLCLAMFNLLPFPSLDGGRALRAALLLRLDTTLVSRIMIVIAILFGSLLVTASFWISLKLGGGLWPILVGALTLLRVGLCILEEEKNQL